MSTHFPEDMQPRSAATKVVSLATGVPLSYGSMGWIMFFLLFLVSWGYWFWLIVALFVVGAMAIMVVGDGTRSTEGKILPLLGLGVGALVLMGERGYVAKLYYASQQTVQQVQDSHAARGTGTPPISVDVTRSEVADPQFQPTSPTVEVPKERPGTLVQDTPEGVHPLVVNIATAEQIGVVGSTQGDRLNSLLKIKAFRTENEVIINVDVDAKNWPRSAYWLPLLVRIFDEYGHYLTHFTTSEKFTASRQEFDNLPEHLRSLHKIVLLAPTGNRFIYGVNRRDLRDAVKVEIGLFDDGQFFNHRR